MAVVERPQWHTPLPLVRPSETPAETAYYLTPNRKGLDLTLSTYPRRPDVAAYERTGLYFASINPELSKGVWRIFGPNCINKFTAGVLFERIRRPDHVLVDLSGKVHVILEQKTSKGEAFANEARTKIEWLPNFVDVMFLNSALFVDFLKSSFPQDEIKELIPEGIDFQDPSETDLIFLTPYPENAKILATIGKGKFRTVDHRTV